MIWHNEPIAAVLTQLQTDPEQGLSSEEAAARLKFRQRQRQNRDRHRSFGAHLLAVCKHPAYVLVGFLSLLSMALSLYSRVGRHSGEWIPPLVLFALVALRALLDALGATMADRRSTDFQPHAFATARVIRDGRVHFLPAASLVPGDIIELSDGDLIPADCRLLSDFELSCDELPLTGEPVPVSKTASAGLPTVTPLNRRSNMLYAACPVVQGHGRAVVTETGYNTEFQKALHLAVGKQKTPFPHAQSLSEAQAKWHWVSWGVGVLATVLAKAAGQSLLPSLLLGGALTVALTPTDLSTLAPLCFLSGMKRMTKAGAAVFRPDTAQKLGQATVLCSDKTGSFTQNAMTLSKVFANGTVTKTDDGPLPDNLQSLIKLAVLCSGSATDATDAAIWEYARRHSIDPQDLLAGYPRLGEIAFTPERRRMTTVHLIEGQYIVIVKGAPETLLPLCTDCPDNLEQSEELLNAEGLRTLVVAYKPISMAPTHCFAEELECNLHFLGLLGLNDPPREEAAAAVSACLKAGIRPVMLTRDSLGAATATARRIGLIQNRSQTISGPQLAALSDEELAARLPELRVAARLSSADKVRLIHAWQALGEVVAVSGEGVSDMPALKAADIGCVMMRGGAVSAMAGADVLLTDDRFSTMAMAARAGRTLLENLQHALGFWFSWRLALTLVLLLSLLFGGSALLTPAVVVGGSLLAVLAAFWVFPREADNPSAGRLSGQFAGRLLRPYSFLTGLYGLLAAGLLLHSGTAGTVSTACLWFWLLFGLLWQSCTPRPLGRSHALHAPGRWLSAAAFAAVCALMGLCAPVAKALQLVGGTPFSFGALIGFAVCAELGKWVRPVVRRALYERR